MDLKVRRTFTARVKTMPLFYFAGRPEAVPYIRPLGGVVRVGGDALLARRLIQRAVSRRVGHRPALYNPNPHQSVLASPRGRGGNAVRH